MSGHMEKMKPLINKPIPKFLYPRNPNEKKYTFNVVYQRRVN